MKHIKKIVIAMMIILMISMNFVAFANGNDQLDEIELEHSLKKVAAVAATATTSGNIEYWYCTGCGKYFSDSNGNNEITDKSSVVIPAGTNVKKANPLTLKIESKIFKRSSLKKSKSFKIGANGKGNITYSRNAKAKKAKIKVSSKGKVTIPKKCKKGTYKITVKAAGNDIYNVGTKTVTIKVK